MFNTDGFGSKALRVVVVAYSLTGKITSVLNFSHIFFRIGNSGLSIALYAVVGGRLRCIGTANSDFDG